MSKLLSALIALSCLVACGVENTATEESLQTTTDELRNPLEVYLNHTYTMVSQPTIDALQTNAYLQNQFVDVEVRTTVRPDLTYTGTYLNLKRTYLEFFPTGTFGYPRGVTGIALGTEKQGAIERLQANFEASFNGQVYPVDLVSHDVNGVSTPWFNSTSPMAFDTTNYAAFWAMQYVPNAGSTAPRTRLQERATRYAPSKLGEDVRSSLVLYPAVELPLVRKAFEAAKWKLVNEGQGFRAVSRRDAGVRRVLHFQPSTESHVGTVAIEFSLNRWAPAHYEALGDAALLVARDRAQLWFFQPSTEQQNLLAVEDQGDD